MYKVMLIDDERALRNLLKKCIPWEELGMQVAGEAASGSEAINTIDEIGPDIVLVDIRMPFMDGIEFSRLAKARYPDLKIIILTAYDEFDYARACISIGINDYLLKPIDRKEVAKVLKDIVEKMPKRKEEEIREPEVPVSTMQKIQEYLKENYTDSQINLTSVAQEFGLHPSYLSRKFKAETGKSFIDCLTSYRMEKASYLARNGEVMYLAAEKVGVPDPNYFGKCFKKYKNESYSDYVKRYGGRTDER